MIINWYSTVCQRSLDTISIVTSIKNGSSLLGQVVNHGVGFDAKLYSKRILCQCVQEVFILLVTYI